MAAAIWERIKQQWDLLLIDYSYSYWLLLLSIPLILLFSSLVLIATSTSLNRNRTTILHGLYLRQNQPTYITMFFSRSTLLHVLVASAVSIPFIAAQTAQTELTTDQMYGTLVSTAAPAPGFNVEGGSVFQNYVDAVNNKQFFSINTEPNVYEHPEYEHPSHPTGHTRLLWCSDLTFSDSSNGSLTGMAGRCVKGKTAGEDASGGPILFDKTRGISAVFVEQQNVFEGQVHSNTDNWVYRYWDSGMKTAPQIRWEGHDEGDMSADADLKSRSSFGEFIWMSVEEVAQAFNTSVDMLTPDTFNQVYEEAWIIEHKKEAAEKNPNTEAEEEIIDEVKGETDSTGETTSPTAPGTAGDGSTEEDGGTDPIDDSAGGRKLASVAARFASAALRVFGI